jgi:hypothetical protein
MAPGAIIEGIRVKGPCHLCPGEDWERVGNGQRWAPFMPLRARTHLMGWPRATCHF